MDRLIRNLEFLQVVLTEGKRCIRGCDTILIRCQQADERILRNHFDRFSRIEAEHSTFKRASLERHGLGVKELTGLLDLD